MAAQLRAKALLRALLQQASAFALAPRSRRESRDTQHSRLHPSAAKRCCVLHNPHVVASSGLAPVHLCPSDAKSPRTGCSIPSTASLATTGEPHAPVHLHQPVLVPSPCQWMGSVPSWQAWARCCLPLACSRYRSSCGSFHT